jgi:hypothetical protein
MTTTIKAANGIEYVRREFVDAWGRQRVCDKRVTDLPKPHATACGYCGEPIKATRSTRRFCSLRCRVAAHRAAKRVEV